MNAEWEFIAQSALPCHPEQAIASRRIFSPITVKILRLRALHSAQNDIIDGALQRIDKRKFECKKHEKAHQKVGLLLLSCVVSGGTVG